MASETVCGLIFRLLLPVCLLVACMFRYNGISFVYLIYLLLIPLFSEPTKITMQGHTGRLLKSLCFTSLSFLLMHIIFQITINSLEARNTINPYFNCTTWEKTLRQIGFESVKGADAGNGIRVFVPDIGMFIASLATWLFCKKLVQKSVTEEDAQYNTQFVNEEMAEMGKMEMDDALMYEEDFDEHDGIEEAEESTRLKLLRKVASIASKLKELVGNIIATAGKVVVTILLGITGMMLPSLTSAVYFFVFLGLCTWWSCCRVFDPLIFSCLCVLMAIFSAGHLIGLYLYQFQFFQEIIPPGDFYARLFGVTSIVQTNCSTTWKFIANPDIFWYHYTNPIMLLVLYYTLATLIRLWLQEPVVIYEENRENEEGDGVEACSPPPLTAERRRSLWYATHYPTDERKLLSMTQDEYKPSDVLLVTVNGTPVDYHAINTSLPIENGPTKIDMYSTPQYKWERTDEISEKKEEEEEEEQLEEDVSEKKENAKVHAMVVALQFIMKQSYICALISMMAWSITYHSWLTFVLLIWSCALWMIRDRRKYAMLSSPFMVVYGNLLVTLQYIWSIDLPTELKDISGLLERKSPEELASKILFNVTFWLLLRQHLTEQKILKVQEATLSEIKVGSQDKEEEIQKTEDEEEDENDIMKVLGNMVMAMFVKYWIYVCGGMFFFVSFEGKIVMYKIIYMMLFLFCVALYQVHYEWWRRILKYFWMSVVVYTMLVLILIYTYQFKSFPPLWMNMTGLDKDKLADLGLETFTLTDLFTRIFIPTSFLLVCILHLHYFHDHFLQLTDLKAVTSKQDNTIYRLVHPDGSLPDITMMNLTSESEMLEEKEEKQLEVYGHQKSQDPDEWEKGEDKGGGGTDEEDEEEADEEDSEEEETSDSRNKWHLVIDRLTVLFLKFLEYFHKMQVFAWWFLELHIIKIVTSYIIWVTLREVSLLNYVFLTAWAFALPYSQLRPLASSVCTVWTCVIIVCKMLYQLATIEPLNFSSNCTMPFLNQTNIVNTEDLQKSLLYSGPIDPSGWVGLKKSIPLLSYLRNNLLMLFILAFEVTIYRHQEYYRCRNNLTAPVTKTIFHDITRQHLDDGLINCAKYFINYFFYKFGMETCFLLSVNVIGQRMDFFAMIHSFWLFAVLYRRRRKAIAEIWHKYCCFLACIITFQYFICIGIPPAPCKDYPWRHHGAKFNSNIIKWLYFPDFIVRPNPLFLIYDFMLLLCASLQKQVFEDENKAAVRIMAGDNVEICMNLDAASFSQHNPVPDFIHCRSYLDMCKVIMFSYLFWFVLTIIFITGTTRISIFCMGYLVACFYFLLFGGDLLLKPIRSILRYWDWLIAYNVFVITMKNILSIGACGYIDSLIENSCWLIQAFSLACTVKGYDIPMEQKNCQLPSGEAGIIWDSICFAFLLLQRRVFMSYYFLHVVADIKSSQILASRGAELFQATIVKAVKARLEEEKKSMDQLKRQMDRIKARQEKYKKGKERMLSLAQESGEGHEIQKHEEDDDEGEAEKEKVKGKKKQWWRPWVDHASMVRSGDYYLFETDSEEEEEDETKDEDELRRKSAFQRAIGKFASAILALPKSVIKLPKTILQYLIRAAKFIYQAWITNPKTALRQRRKENKEEKEREMRRKSNAKGHIIIDCDDKEEEHGKKKSDGPDNVIKRIFNILKFTWVLFLASLDSFTAWLNSISREHIDISTVLRIERCMLTREIKKGNVPTRESIHMYYQNHIMMSMSRESGLDRIDNQPGSSSSQSIGKIASKRMDSADSAASHDSMSSCNTEATMLFSRQSTLDDLDGPDAVPKTSERARPRLRKMHSMDMSSSSADSGSVASSEPTQCTMVYSRQGTAETIEEVEDEQEEDGKSPTSRLDASDEEYCADLEGSSYTPDTELALYSTGDGDLPPSYSKAVSFEQLSFASRDDSADNILMVLSPDDSHIDKMHDAILPTLTHELTASELLLNKMFQDEELEDSEKFYIGQPRLLQLIYALYNTLVARSELVCYFVIILNHMISASIITLVLPILIFLWAMLSVPRPSKRFWMAAIVYTEVTIVIKYFFQFGFFPWNSSLELYKDKPYHVPNIIGVEKKEGYVHYDLVQLLALFFHRSILKCHGLWDEDDVADNGTHKDDTDGEMSEGSGRRDSVGSLKSVNLAASVESIHVHFPEEKAAIRRKSSSSGSQISHRSSFSSHRSKRGSTSTRNSSQKGSSIASVKQKSRKELLMEKLREQLIKAKAFAIKTFLQIYLPIRQFFYNLIHPDYSAVTDVYVLMFLADTVDFIIIVFGFWAFGKHSAAADITSSLSEDQVPEAFLVMVLIQFGTMVVDRALYLRKTVMGKVIFQVILVFGIHFWMFFILPGVTDRKFSQNTVAQLWYFVKCIYFGLSAYQIRCGYPTRVLGNFLTKSYNYVNLFLFQGFRLVPFLTELRAVMDWVWTDTTLSLSSWICVEDIYAHIFILKCWRESEKRYPQPRGQKKKKVVKYGMGGMIVVLLICIVWFPLLFMSLIKSVAGVTNKPLDVSIKISLGGFQPIFTMSAQQNQLKDMDGALYKTFEKSLNKDTSALQFLEGYGREDITIAELEGNSNSLWTISPPSRNSMIQSLINLKHDFTLVVQWTIQRNFSLGAKAEITGEKHTVSLTNATRLAIADMMEAKESKTVMLEHIYPWYIKAPSDSTAKPILQLLKDQEFVNINVSLKRNGTGDFAREWWVLNQVKKHSSNNVGLELFVFSDKVSPPSLGFLAGYGIMGLYASVVLVIGKFVREFFSGISHSIMFEELPNVDRILKLCTDIFLVRETGELELEEDLYAKLIFLYRSPETMIKWTREKNK
ncbi:piezo-type mechanosensitive ion channel component 2 [Leptodactylus fuscus]|uniref:piezo-type mechanosensitive ion channel component 2 n=1 Tax=Leptodactylus fuscus TaxID=238119 RepID=UPI003F4F3E86